MRPLRIGYLNFPSAVLESKLPVLLIFGAMWDQRSREMFHIIDMYGNTYDGKIVMGKVDIDYATELFFKYEVTKMPTAIFFEHGKPFKSALVEYIDDLDDYINEFFSQSLN